MFFDRFFGKRKDDEPECSLYNIVLVGDFDSHKFDLLNSFVGGTARSSGFQVIDTKPRTKEVVTPSGIKVNLKMAISGDNDSSEPILPSYYNNVHGILLCYKISQRSSFDSMIKDLRYIQSRIKDPAVVIHIIGISQDAHDKQIVTQNELHAFAEKHHAKSSFCYLDSIASINKVFETIVLDIGKKKGINYGSKTDPSSSSSLRPELKPVAPRKSFFDIFKSTNNESNPPSDVKADDGANLSVKVDDEMMKEWFGRFLRDENRIVYKLSIVGCEGVGKTSLVKRYKEDTYDGKRFADQKGDNFAYHREIPLDDGMKITLLMMNDSFKRHEDNTGMADYLDWNCKMAHAVIMCYDVTNRSSFVSIAENIGIPSKVTLRKAVRGLVGLKYDSKERVEVAGSEAKALADANGMFFRECSAKDGTGVSELFAKIIYELYVVDKFCLPVSEEDANYVEPLSVLPGEQ